MGFDRRDKILFYICAVVFIYFLAGCETSKGKANSVTEDMKCSWSIQHRFCACVSGTRMTYKGFGFAAPDHACGR